MHDRLYIAGVLREIGRLLKLKDDNPYKVRAYERAARAVENFAGDFDRAVEQRTLTSIDGIGNALAAVIEEAYRSGESAVLQELRAQMPPGAAELSAVAGLSFKKVTALNQALGIVSVDDLRTACERGLVRTVKGFGTRAEAKILAAIDQPPKLQQRTLLVDAMTEADRLSQYLRLAPEISRCEVAGSLRRRKETVGRIILVAASDHHGAAMEHFRRFPAFVSIASDGTGAVGRLAAGVEVELVVVAPADFVTALHQRTGSPGHYAALEERAAAKGFVLGSAGMRAAGKRIKIGSEADIYRRLGLSYIAPELRENEGELEAAAEGSLPQSLAQEDIRGMVHCHTAYSDGQSSVEEMALAAEAMGMEYLTITDHSPSAFYARGVGLDRLRAQWDEIDRVQERVRIKILKGTESDILADGSLDYPDEILEKFDIIIASIHARHKMDRQRMTERLLRALKLPFFKIWGHPLGRLLQSRPPLECHMEEVLDAAALSRTAIEVNGNPHRLDLEPRWIRAARERGIRFVVSTDAHSTRELNNLSFATAMAQRGWLSAHEVLNTLDAAGFMAAVRP